MKVEVTFNELNLSISIYEVSSNKVVVNLKGDFIKKLKIDEVDDVDGLRLIIKSKNQRW